MNRTAERSERRRFLTCGAGLVVGTLAYGCGYSAVLANSPARSSEWERPIKGFDVGSLRSERHREQFFRDIAATGAKLVRIFIEFRWDESEKQYLLPYTVQGALPQLLRAADTYSLKLVLAGDFETLPNPPLWGDPARAAAFAAAWQRLASILKDTDCIIGYDLLNEPNPPWRSGSRRAALDEWRSLARKAIQAIRSVDPGATVVFQGIGGGQALGLPELVPFAEGNVVYSIHFYSPHPITHQQVSSRWPRALPYPVSDDSLLKGTDAYPGPWDLGRLRASMQDAVDFQTRYHVPIFVGEFSCVRWAPGQSAQRYIRDVLALFNEFGWSWCYHEFRGWPGWDAEIVSADRASEIRSADAPTMALLRREFARA